MKTINKPWGREEILEVNSKYVLKRLIMNKGCRCSLQHHEKKTETIYVLSGLLRLYLNGNYSIMTPGDVITIKPFDEHRMEGLEGTVYLEASTPELDDVVRIKDDYRRT